MNPILKVRDVCLSYHTLSGETPALSHISFDLMPGEFLSIVGPSGCGKSTLLNLIAGLLAPECGSITLDEKPVSAGSTAVGYMLQKDHLLEWRSIYKNILLGLEIRKELTPEKLSHAEELLRIYGLDRFRDARPSQLSGGMRQRAALIRTLVLKPELLLLDEPFSALDYQTRLNVSDDIGKILRNSGKPAILVTHDISEAISMADRVLILSPRPATVQKIVDIHLNINNRTPLSSRNAPDFKKYFNLIWKEPEISRHQKQYLLQYKKEKRLIFTARILLFVLFMGLWEMSARCGWIDSFIFSSPSLIGKTFLSMCRDQSLFSHIGVTLTETLVSFFFVVILGVGTAILLWCSPKTSRILEPYLVVLNSLPKSALAPLLIVWLGANERTIVVAGMSVAIFGSVINLYSGFCQADPEKLKLIETLGGHKKEKLTKIILPASLPLIISVMKVNIGLCLVGVIIGEFIGARKGLGYLIIYGSQTFKLTWVLMSIMILCIIAMGLYAVLNLLEKYIQKR